MKNKPSFMRIKCPMRHKLFSYQISERLSLIQYLYKNRKSFSSYIVSVCWYLWIHVHVLSLSLSLSFSLSLSLSLSSSSSSSSFSLLSFFFLSPLLNQILGALAKQKPSGNKSGKFGAKF